MYEVREGDLVVISSPSDALGSPARQRLPERGEGRMFENFAVASLSYFNRLEEMPVFTARNFYSVCMTLCATRSYVAKQARSILCGY